MRKGAQTPVITARTMQSHDLPALVDLRSAQQVRQATRDPRLPRSATVMDLTSRRNTRASEHGALVVHDQHGRVRGAAIPAVWQLSAESTLLAFLTPRNGIARLLTLPSPQEGDAELVANALLSALALAWKQQGTTGELIRWPSVDPWIERVLLAHGFQVDSVCALHPAGPPGFAVGHAPASLHVRHARSSDEPTLLRLFEDEMRFHEACVPFARNSPAALRGFQTQVARLWRGEHLEQGAPLVLVAEQHGQVLAMADCRLLDLSAEEEPGFTPPGRYGCIDNVCVDEQVRGQGIGRFLVQAVFAAFSSSRLDGYLLWYHPSNPLAAPFWQRLGFVPLWTTYQSLHSMTWSNQ